VNYDNSLVVTITVTCNSWAPSGGDHLFSCGAISGPPHYLCIRGGTGSGLPESTPAGFCVFLSDPDADPESKICGKPDPESLFHFGSSRSLCRNFLGENMNILRLDQWL